LRNELRSSLAHNGPVIDESEIAEFDGLWRIKRDTTAVTVAEWSVGDETLLEATQHAYLGLANGGITVTRRWRLVGNRLEVIDKLEGSGSHGFNIRFTLPGNYPIQRNAENHIEIEGTDGERLVMECSLALEISEGWYSPGYGLAAVCNHITVADRFDPPYRIQYMFRLLESDHLPR
jgi:hypothetical protein